MEIIPVEGVHAPAHLCHVYELCDVYQRQGWTVARVVEMFRERYHYEPARVWTYKTAGGIPVVACEVRG